MVERGFASMRYLVRDVLKEAGDAVVLEPAGRARRGPRGRRGDPRGAVAPPVAAR